MNIIGRSTWSARYGVGAKLSRPVPLVVIHHFWRPHVPPDATPDREREIMRSVEHFHGGPKAEGNQGWAGIGYNFVIFLSGRVYEGRGWRRIGAHTEGQNSGSVGIAFAMDGDRFPLTPEARDACRGLIAAGVIAGHIDARYKIAGHRDFAPKSCPGKLVYPLIQELRPEHDDEPVVGLWDTGPAVVEVQRTLGLSETGAFGRDDAAAVARFQRAHGLLDDGIVGPNTWPVLRAHRPPGAAA